MPDFLDFLGIGATTFSSVDGFNAKTNPDSANFYDFNALIGSGPFKGEQIDVSQFAVYAQAEFQMSEALKLTSGMRVDCPIYVTHTIENPFAKGLTLLH